MPSSTRVLLEGAGTLSRHRRKDIIYAQGAPAKTIFYINEGMVTLTVSTKTRQLAVAVLGAGSFFNEICLLDHSRCTSTASTITSSSILSIERDEMSRLLGARNGVSTFLTSRLVSSNWRFCDDLVSALTHSIEQRLARLLLHLARLNAEDQRKLPKITQQVLSDMIGATRARTNIFMNRFRKLGFINDENGLRIDSTLRSLLT